ncbi:MAG: bifunctional DNA-formamidopyrimidine glycosylase/DNA-(apurinic or apyrimidinic site) lyase [Bdellovibrionales bacterium]|nr:bifunctional DNA-formamidopyrimidine glycosylase/DNA-(apurinic or apyrimidinic site) lyase [Bdellovibrionales bacterium]
MFPSCAPPRCAAAADPMPELPEVETVCRGLDKTMTGKTLARLELRRKGLRFPFPKGLAARVQNRRITGVRRRAKYILIDLAGDTPDNPENNDVLIAHLGMTGRMVMAAADEKYTAEKHDHVIFHFTDGSRMVFNDARRFGVLDIAAAADVAQTRHFAHLGPEPLDDSFSAAYLNEALANKKTAIKIAIMDQETVVGVGNIYAAEALFDARIDPARPANSLTKGEVKKLWAAIRAVLQRAIAAGGSSIRDYVQTDGELGYFQHQWAVYGKEGEKCRGCTCPLQKTGGIKRITQGGRSTFYCPARQK